MRALRCQPVVMCNSYRIIPELELEKGVRAKDLEAAKQLASPLVRKSDPGIVVLADRRVADAVRASPGLGLWHSKA